MKYTVLYAHPNPKSFNHAILERVQENLQRSRREFLVRDLYGMNFNPLLTGHDFMLMQQGKLDPVIKGEQETIRSSEGLIVIHPIWWFSMPAMLKGYIDRVFTRGFAYDYTDQGPKGLLTGKKVHILNTTGGSADDYRNYGFADALKHTMDMGTYGFCGLEVAQHHFFHSVPGSTDDARRAMLEEVSRMTF